MKTIKFIKTENGKSETIFTWREVLDEDVQTICGNFMEGFLYGVDAYGEINFIRPMVMSIDGYKAWTRGGLEMKMVVEDK